MIGVTFRKNNKKAKKLYKNAEERFWDTLEYRLNEITHNKNTNNDPFEVSGWYYDLIFEWPPLKILLKRLFELENFITEDSKNTNNILELALIKIMLVVKYETMTSYRFTDVDLNREFNVYLEEKLRNNPNSSIF